MEKSKIFVESKPFADSLKEARITKGGLNQSEFAKLVGINGSHINRLERGLRNPPKRNVVLKIASKLEMNVDEANEFLLTAGYAPLKESDNYTIEKDEVKEIVSSVSEALISLLEDPNLSLEEKFVFKTIVRNIPIIIKEIKKELKDIKDIKD